MEAKVAQEGLILTEAQLVALEKAKQEKVDISVMLVLLHFSCSSHDLATFGWTVS